MLDTWKLLDACGLLKAAGLLTGGELTLLNMFAGAPGAWPAAAGLAALARGADAWHLHVKVGGERAVPAGVLSSAGLERAFERPGFVEYELPEGVGLGVSFSWIPVAVDQKQVPAAVARLPRLDHVGFDFPAAAITQGVPQRVERAASDAGWATEAQGDDQNTVRCCFASVLRKVWVFPPAGPDVDAALEFGFGELERDAAMMGDDLRPARPGIAGGDGIVGQGCCGSR